jgi:hypothetical protein
MVEGWKNIKGMMWVSVFWNMWKFVENLRDFSNLRSRNISSIFLTHPHAQQQFSFTPRDEKERNVNGKKEGNKKCTERSEIRENKTAQNM